MKPILTMLLVLVTVSHSQAGLTLWSGEPNDVTITGNTATINAAGTFKLQSVTNGNLDVIDLIQIANDVTGTVTIHVRRNPNDMAGDDGATHVGAINLTNSHAIPVVGNLAELRITGDLGTADEIVIRYLRPLKIRAFDRPRS